MEQANVVENTDLSQKQETGGVQFEKFCQDVGLPEAEKTRSCNVWQEILTRVEANTAVQMEQELYCVAVYTAVIDTSMPYGPSDPHLNKQPPPCVTLTDLLKRANINVIRFIDRVRELREEVVFSEAVRSHMSLVEKRYCITSPLFSRFDREWGTVFREDDSVKSGDLPFSQTEGSSYYQALCWTMFLLGRDSLLEESHELIHSYNLLLSCLEFVLRNTPSFQLQEPFDMLRLKSTENLDQNGYNVAVLEKLAEKFQTSFEDLQSIQTVTEVFLQGLKNKSGDLDLIQLQAVYHERYRRRGDLDELQFLQHEPHLMPDTSRVVSTSAPSFADTPVTPVRAALNTIQQLKNILASSKDTPSPELVTFFQNCAVNPSDAINNRLADLKVKFVEQYIKVTGQGHADMASKRFQQAVTLYYRVMKRLLDMEKERLSLSDFSNLLNNDTFHRSLLACAVEIVLMTYNVSWNPSKGAMGSEKSNFEFPWILGVIGLFPYNFYKVLESFIKAEPNLTPEIIKHLTIIEYKILDSSAWKADSPVFEALAKLENGHTSTLLTPNKDLNPAGAASASTAAELYLSPVRGQRTRGGSPNSIVFISPRKSAPSSKDSPEPKTGVPKRSQSLNMFLNKVCRLGYNRLKSLCDMLHVPKDIQQKIWTCFEVCITCRTDLMKNRHLDQIMMCSLYGICKVSDHEIKFKDIVKAYSAQPHAEPETYKQAWIEDVKYDSIISFYNQIYMQSMKGFILQFAKQQNPTLSPAPRPVNSPLTASPVYSMPGRRNFYVSPLRESPFKSPQSPSNMTPRSRQLYNFGEGIGSAEKLKNINETLSAFKSKNSTTPKSLKRLSFDGPEETNQNSPGSSCEDTSTVVVKKKRITPPAAIPRSGDSVRCGPSGASEKSDSLR